MKSLKTVFVLMIMTLLVSSAALAGDFDWLRDLNIQAEADPSGFRARLGARFKIGDAEIRTVLGTCRRLHGASAGGNVKATNGLCR